MKTLYIDTHLNDITLSLYNDYELLREEKVIGERQNSRFLMPSLEKLLEGEDFDEILVINGPGSFTGVRLGVTIAKTLAYTKNKAIKAISYFDAMNVSSDTKDHVLAISDGNGYFIGEYKDYKKDKEFYYLNNSEYREFSSQNDINTDVTIDMKKVLEYAKTLESISPHAVNPIYIKLIGVEYAKKDNK